MKILISKQLLNGDEKVFVNIPVDNKCLQITQVSISKSKLRIVESIKQRLVYDFDKLIKYTEDKENGTCNGIIKIHEINEP